MTTRAEFAQQIAEQARQAGDQFTFQPIKEAHDVTAPGNPKDSGGPNASTNTHATHGIGAGSVRIVAGPTPTTRARVEAEVYSPDKRHIWMTETTPGSMGGMLPQSLCGARYDGRSIEPGANDHLPICELCLARVNR